MISLLLLSSASLAIVLICRRHFLIFVLALIIHVFILILELRLALARRRDGTLAKALAHLREQAFRLFVIFYLASLRLLHESSCFPILWVDLYKLFQVRHTNHII